LHQAEDRCLIIEEETAQVEQRLAEAERALTKLQRDKVKSDKLVQGLKKELALLKRKVGGSHAIPHLVGRRGILSCVFSLTAWGLFSRQLRENNRSQATMESQIERYRLQKDSLTRMMSSADDGPGGYEHALGTVSPIPTSPSVASAVSHTHTPEHAGSQAQEATELAVLRAENHVLMAELDAAKAVADTEVERRVALEAQMERLKQRLEDRAAEGDTVLTASQLLADSESEMSELNNPEVDNMVMKEVLSSLRDLNPVFQPMWGGSETDFKVRGKTYAFDGVKIDARIPLFELIHMELFDVETDLGLRRADHITAMFQDVRLAVVGVLALTWRGFLT
jgi:hypothetical protein